VRGIHINWTQVLPTAQRVPLPTYAFQHQRYWPKPTHPTSNADTADGALWSAIDEGDADTLAEDLAVDKDLLEQVLPALSSWRRRSRANAQLDSWRYRVTWTPVPGAEPRTSGRLLVVVPAVQAAEDRMRSVLAGLAARGADVVPVEATDLTRDSLAEVLDGSENADWVVSLLSWEVEGEPAAGTTALVQALADRGITAPLWCVTSGAVSVANEAAEPEQAAVWGLGGVLALDGPDTFGGLVDLPAGELSEDTLDLLTAALGAPGGEDQLAVRDGKLHARRLVRESSGGREWIPRGTVLVTGGTGGLGTHVARWLAGNGAAHIVLASRKGPDALGATELAAEVETLGALCTIVACDISDTDALAAVIAEAERNEPLSAVVHTAGAGLAATPVTELTVEQYSAVTRGKVEGARVLDRLLGDRELDAFVLFSSGAAVWGSGGQAPYAAANAHLDGLAANRRARGQVATSVAWGGWGGGHGMIGDGEDEQWRRIGIRPMDPALAVRGMALAVGTGRTTTVVADIDWERFVPGYTMTRERPLLRELPEVTALLTEPAEAATDSGDVRAQLVARLTGLSPAEQEELLAGLVQAETAAVLGHSNAEAVERDRAFKDTGFDSVTAVELRNRLNALTGLRLAPTVVFDHPKPTVLARALRAELAPATAVTGGTVTAAEVADWEDDIRRALASVPLARFEELGVLDVLLSVAGPAAEPERGEVDEELNAIAGLDLAGLVQRAMRDTSDRKD
ncbi:SDR family NAD(P)-dependent oxidoreductase, partial [Amycolatopsis sp. NPDC051061]|uniref:SDR family NAD(P)-dependent oxidoreductase n=1 Tax=Amycolatopsis sp. NPDC051061 TaxID=3155042 RepID=UPI003432B966